MVMFLAWTIVSQVAVFGVVLLEVRFQDTFQSTIEWYSKPL